MPHRIVGEAALIQDRGVVAVVVDRGLQVTIDAADAEREVVGQLLLEAEDVLVLVHRIEVLRSDRPRRLGLTVFTVEVAEVTAGNRIDRRAGDRVDATEREGFAAEDRGAGAADGDARGQRQRVTTGVTEHLERRVAHHVPGEAQTRTELVVDLDVGLALAVDVLEAVPTRAQVGDEVVGDVPAVLDVERALLDLDFRTLAEDLLLDDVGRRGRQGAVSVR